MGRIKLHNPTVWIGGMLVVVLLIHNTGFSQKPDTTLQRKQTSQITREHSPTKAALLSAAMPGLGQVYNKKYWKIPILYAGGAFVYYLYDFYSENYNEYNNAYAAFLSGKINQYNGLSTEEQLKAAKDFYRRYRDLNVIIMVGVYLVNIVDATVDAYLFNFDVSPDLSLRPTTLATEKYHHVPGVSLTFRF
ncbi:MAG: hypothetical protein KGY60_07140 [Bacteroidales bacterium]|nr:hypothetical protein [Bacteroidales bacterium]